MQSLIGSWIYGRRKIIYLAGLFDGEGCVTYKKYWEYRNKKPKYKCWRIRLEINMIDKDTIDYVAKTLKPWYEITENPRHQTLWQ